jgi:hypothetical protein
MMMMMMMMMMMEGENNPIIILTHLSCPPSPTSCLPLPHPALLLLWRDM